VTVGWPRFLVAALAAALAACSFKPVDVTPREALIASLPADIPVAATLPVTLLVLATDSHAAYDTALIAYSTVPNELAHYAHTEWAQPPARMLHPLIVRTLERTHRFRSVVVPPHSARTGYTLATELLELRQDFTEEPAVAHVVMRLELRGADSRAPATRELEASEPLAEKSPQAAVAATNAATAKLMAQLAAFVVENSR